MNLKNLKNPKVAIFNLAAALVLTFAILGTLLPQTFGNITLVMPGGETLTQKLTYLFKGGEYMEAVKSAHYYTLGMFYGISLIVLAAAMVAALVVPCERKIRVIAIRVIGALVFVVAALIVWEAYRYSVSDMVKAIEKTAAGSNGAMKFAKGMAAGLWFVIATGAIALLMAIVPNKFLAEVAE